MVEVLAAVVILLVGVMGVMAMADGANKSTVRTKSHEAATGLVRDMTEAVHALPYSGLSATSLNSTLAGRQGFADAAPAPGWQVKRRGTVFTVTTSVCVFDDAKDGGGVHDGGYCADTGPAGTADVSPSDYKRVTVALSWPRDGGGTETVKQATLVMNSDRGPSVTALDTNPAGNPAIVSGNSVGFALSTSVAPAKLEWYLDGAYQQDLGSGISGSGLSYAFSWGIGSACSNNAVIDGTYLVSARAFNAGGSTPGPRALTVRLNRCLPFAPTALAGGRNRWGVELNWEDNREDDVVGYRLYRGIGSATPAAVASGPCSGVIKTSTCLEPDPSASQSLVYNVRAVDRGSTGALRDGTATGNLTVITNNRAPAIPAIGSAGAYGTIGWYAVTDPDKNDVVDFYRIYRDGQALANRYDVIDASGSPIVWTDGSPGTGTHTYYVTAVDQRLAESGFSNPVAR